LESETIEGAMDTGDEFTGAERMTVERRLVASSLASSATPPENS
jgi:hypothetical protein